MLAENVRPPASAASATPPASAKDAAGATATRVELYTQEPMVNWLSPVQLLMTALRVTAARTIGAFADARAVQAALNPASANPAITVPADADGNVWVDYLADTGDGWHSTYSMALCASQAVHLQAKTQAKAQTKSQTQGQAQDLTLPRASVLLLGGDQVYPTPADQGYRTRFVDPFRAAFPAPVDTEPSANSETPIEIPDAPLMVATPGNHDWYDGLRGFAQLFCSGEPLGVWRTAQRTSYYVLKLPHGWWIWGLDLQLDSEMDRRQYEYFVAMHAQLSPGDRVVLCTPEPSWIDEMERLSRAARQPRIMETRTPRFRSLSKIEQLLGEHLAVVLAGDNHHYVRYTPLPGTTGPQRMTCGGGGAFLHGTHQLPTSPPAIAIGRNKQHYAMAGEPYPDMATSRRLRNRAWQLPIRNVGLCALFASLYFLFGWILQSASWASAPVDGQRSIIDALAARTITPGHIGGAVCALWHVMSNSPASVFIAIAIPALFAALSIRGFPRALSIPGLVGALHGLLHVALAVALFWALARLNLHAIGLSSDDALLLPLLLIETLLVGGILGGLLFGIWMVLANRFWGLHAEEVFSSQAIADYKCFLRMRIDAEALTIYPLKLEKVCRRWKLGKGVKKRARLLRTWRLVASTASRGPRFVPMAGQPVPPDSMQLIEPPIVIRRNGAHP